MKRVALYRIAAAFLRAWANLANEMERGRLFRGRRGAGDRGRGGATTRQVRKEVKLASGDYVDMKMYEPAMRHLLDTYIRAEESEQALGVRRSDARGSRSSNAGQDAVDAPARGHPQRNPEAVAETIENNVRRIIIDEMRRSTRGTTRGCRSCWTP